MKPRNLLDYDFDWEYFISKEAPVVGEKAVTLRPTPLAAFRFIWQEGNMSREYAEFNGVTL